MSLELWNTLATFGTFVVIAATAIAAIVQLRHARTSNQIAALNEFRETTETPEFQAAQTFIATQLNTVLNDPAFRYQLINRAARTVENQALIAKIRAVGNFWDVIGLLVKAGFVDRDVVLEVMAGNVVTDWHALAPVEAIDRRAGNLGGWDNFEYLTVLSQNWIAAHPSGTYPPGMRRIEVVDKWADEDERYAAALDPSQPQRS
ncbi:MAG: DUF4760 domain-containing protein [Candidatus Eremiobacteraeota bacterium]|nr:DUF4760 domain-containing protein [Candidatus Eremiobacteraeota bacterium]